MVPGELATQQFRELNLPSGRMVGVEEHPRLDWHLENWAQSILFGDQLPELRCKTSSFWCLSRTDLDTMCDTQEGRVASIVNALIRDLPLPHRTAVGVMHLGQALYDPIDDLLAWYHEARASLSLGLHSRAVY